MKNSLFFSPSIELSEFVKTVLYNSYFDPKLVFILKRFCSCDFFLIYSLSFKTM